MAHFFYHVNGTMIRSKGNDTNMIEVNEIFKDDNPIIAREKAFKCYQNYIDIFLESKGLQYISHEVTERVLQDFFNSYKKSHFKLAGEIIDEINIDYDKGLTIYLVMENSKLGEGQTLFEDRLVIHYIDNQFIDIHEHVLNALLQEFTLYEKYGYDYKDYKREYVLTGSPNGPKIGTLLESSLDIIKILENISEAKATKPLRI